jgi:hypothetical protein
VGVIVGPQTLCVEGLDPDELIAGIRATYGDQVLITEIATVRRGGVLGLFAHELYRVSFDPDGVAPAPGPGGYPPATYPAGGYPPAMYPPSTYPPSTYPPGGYPPARSLAGDAPGGHHSAAEPAEPPAGSDERSGRHRARAESVAQHPSAAVGRIERLVEQLPVAPPLPRTAGAVVALVGAPEQLAAAAELLAAELHLAGESIWLTGPVTGRPRVIAGPTDAVTQAARLRTATTVSLVTIELTPGLPGQPFGWAPQLLAALAPTAVWAVVDAGRKVEDLRAELAPLGLIDALVVVGAARTATPGTVWDLEIPIAIVDGRPATPGAWAGLLFDALRRP